MVKGIDVSHYQGTVEWELVASAGVSFAYVKATQGARMIDWRFERNMEGVRSAGLQFGAYHFMDPRTEALPQAEHFLSVIDEAKSSDLPPALDIETAPGWGGMTQEVRVKRVAHFMSLVMERTSVRPILYVSPSFWTEIMGAPSQADGLEFGDGPLWIAHYTQAAEPRIPPPWTQWTIWQYSSIGRIQGIEGHVDLNRLNPLATL